MFFRLDFVGFFLYIKSNYLITNNRGAEKWRFHFSVAMFQSRSLSRWKMTPHDSAIPHLESDAEKKR